MARWTDLPAGCKRSMVQGERPGWRYALDQRFECWDTWLVPRESVPQFIQIAGGSAEDIGGVATVIVPLRNKDYDWAIAEEIQATTDGGGWDRVRNDVDVERIRVTYRTPLWNSSFQRVSATPDQRVLQKPVTSASGLATVYSNGYRYNLQLFKRPTVPFDTWAANAGTANNATWRGFATGTVLFEAPAFEENPLPNGVIVYEPTLAFRVNRLRWDYDYLADGTFADVAAVPLVNFTTLFGA